MSLLRCFFFHFIINFASKQFETHEFGNIFEIFLCCPLLSNSFVSLLLLFCSLYLNSLLFLCSYSLPFFGLVKFERWIDGWIDSFGSSPPTLAICENQFIPLSLIADFIHFINIPQKLSDLSQKIIGLERLDERFILTGIMISEHLH